MPRRGALFPTELLGDEHFRKLGPGEQLLFMKLWVSPNLNGAGIDALQLGKWGRGFTPHASEAEMREVLAGLEAHNNWVLADYDTEEILVVPFIRLDSCKQPQMYQNACRSVQTVQSAYLRDKAFEQVLIVHPPPVRLGKSARAEEIRQELVDRNEAAYQELYRFIESRADSSPSSPSSASTTTTSSTTYVPPRRVPEGFPKGCSEEGCSDPPAPGSDHCPWHGGAR